MIVGLLWLLCCQLVGEVIVRVLDVPVPGPVVGLVLLWAVLTWRRTPDDAPVVRTGVALLAHLQLLFVPAGVGVVAFAATLRDEALPLTLALVVSWVVGMAVVGWTVPLLVRGGRTDEAR
ncbi:CidA/LrgA family protein [Nocardioides sp.]|uniref:CidA/LrgA family protein n=1 Tax=Nocardioides sp. TaxID=35761 RepID=UPI002B26D9C0|nr:CidA/LrgA family protein [Nocardioides sp.]